MAAVAALVSLADIQAARTSGDGSPSTSQLLVLAAYAPPQTKFGRVSLATLQAAKAAQENNVSTRVSQTVMLGAFGSGVPGSQMQVAWSFILDGHRFYVLPLGPEGDWAYDTTTQEWCQLQTLGFPGLNFTHGVMWGIRIIGGDALYTYLYELDPNQPLDEEWRAVQHMVTGGIASRSHSAIGVSSFTLTASSGDLGLAGQDISLAFSDDNGVTWSPEFPLPLTGDSTQNLLWSALGSFSTPGRVFRITDFSGPVRLDGADVELTGSGEAQE